MREIVAVKTVGGFVTNDPEKVRIIIKAKGAEFVDRQTAEAMADIFNNDMWASLAKAPAMFHLNEKGEPCGRSNTDEVGKHNSNPTGSTGGT